MTIDYNTRQHFKDITWAPIFAVLLVVAER